MLDNNYAKEVWNNIGDWWDCQLGDYGDVFHKYLVHPYVLDLLNPEADDIILDIACGNGALSRKIAHYISPHKGMVFGIDCSSSLIEAARRRTGTLGLNGCKYEVCDVTNNIQLSNMLSGLNFNKAVCSMALHDIEEVDVIIKFARSKLSDGNSFIVSVPHPCFNSGSLEFIRSGLNNDLGLFRSKYILPEITLLPAKPNQPEDHPQFHRPLSKLLNLFLTNGFRLDKIYEPSALNCCLPASVPLDWLWKQAPHIPPVMILKFCAGSI